VIFECGRRARRPAGPDRGRPAATRSWWPGLHGDRPDRAVHRHHQEVELTFVFGYSPEEFAETLRNIARAASTCRVCDRPGGLEGVAGAFQALGDPKRT